MKLKVAQLSLLVFGVVLLSFAFWNWLVPRPHFITSNPQPGAVLNASPSEVVIQFTEDLAPGSTASVASTITQPVKESLETARDLLVKDQVLKIVSARRFVSDWILICRKVFTGCSGLQ
jgi:methionine-rich copper-binding protein CopC